MSLPPRLEALLSHRDHLTTAACASVPVANKACPVLRHLCVNKPGPCENPHRAVQAQRTVGLLRLKGVPLRYLVNAFRIALALLVVPHHHYFVFTVMAAV